MSFAFRASPLVCCHDPVKRILLGFLTLFSLACLVTCFIRSIAALYRRNRRPTRDILSLAFPAIKVLLEQGKHHALRVLHAKSRVLVEAWEWDPLSCSMYSYTERSWRNSLRANLDKNLNLPKARVVYKSKRPCESGKQQQLRYIVTKEYPKGKLELGLGGA